MLSCVKNVANHVCAFPAGVVRQLAVPVWVDPGKPSDVLNVSGPFAYHSSVSNIKAVSVNCFEELPHMVAAAWEGA